MIVISISLILAFLFAAAGGLVWSLARFLKIISKGLKIFKITLLAFFLFLPVFIFLISPLLVSWLVVTASTRPQDRLAVETPLDYGRKFTDVEFTSTDGVVLRGWWMRGDEDRPTVIGGHGLFRSRREVLERSCKFNEEGYPVLIFDFRNHGQSDDEKVSLGLKERLDFLGAYEFLKQTKGKKRFVFMGVSMGAVAAIHAAVDCQQDLDGVIADSPFQNLKETVAQHTGLLLNLPSFPFVDVFVWNLARTNGISADDLDTVKAFERVPGLATLLIYGGEDRRMPPATARRIFDSITDPKKRLVIFESARHGAAYRSNPKRYMKASLDFLLREQVPLHLGRGTNIIQKFNPKSNSEGK